MVRDEPVRPSERSIRGTGADLRRMRGLEEEEDERIFGWRGNMNEDIERELGSKEDNERAKAQSRWNEERDKMVNREKYEWENEDEEDGPKPKYKAVEPKPSKKEVE